ncbi:phospholipid-binding lipoprotein MlaA [Gammaproteobacteria bacterium]
MIQKLLFAMVVALCFVATNVGVAAAPDPVTVLTTVAPDVYAENYYLEMYNRMMHSFNQSIFSWLAPAHSTTESIATMIPDTVKVGAANFLSNLINEPLIIAASLLEGDHVNARNSATRFVINTSVGLGGILDIAGRLGYSPDYRDLGLAMCKYEVPAGPHIVVPLVGPRTLRDGTADVVLVNVLYLTLLTSIFGASPNVGVITGIILMETIGDLAIVRQIDSPPMDEMNNSYEVIRDRYLHLREARCRDIDAR